MNTYGHASHAPPRNWPHVLIEDGPSFAGLDRGDRIAIIPNAHVHVLTLRLTDEQHKLFVWSSTHESMPGRPYRVDSEGRVWIANADGTDAFSPLHDPVVPVGPWRMRFVGDGPPLATIKRFGEHVAVHPHHVQQIRLSRARSEWILPQDGARNILVVEQNDRDELSWHTEPRRIGVELEALKQAAQGALDVEVAAGIVAQVVPHALSVVGFDGVVPVLEGSRSELPSTTHALVIYAELTGRKLSYSGKNARIEKELATVRKAPPSEIAHVVRALCPDAWAREQALVEECALLDVHSVDTRVGASLP